MVLGGEQTLKTVKEKRKRIKRNKRVKLENFNLVY